MSEENNGTIDQCERIIDMYLKNPELLKTHLSERNAMANKLNERVIKIMNVSPMYGRITENGFEHDFDVTTKELLNQLKKENEESLTKSFPDLSMIINFDM